MADGEEDEELGVLESRDLLEQLFSSCPRETGIAADSAAAPAAPSPASSSAAHVPPVASSLPPGSGSASASSATAIVAVARGGKRARGSGPPPRADADDGDTDIPESSEDLPSVVSVRGCWSSANFDMKCKVDLKTLAFGLRNASYNPRGGTGGSRGNLLLRMEEPFPVVADITATGYVRVHLRGRAKGKSRSAEETEGHLRLLAKKITLLVRKCGYPDARCASFKLTILTCSADLHHPVRLDRLAAKWWRHTLYNPDVTNQLTFRVNSPPCSMQISTGGKVVLTGAESVSDAREALRKVYPLIREFSR